MKRSGRTTKLFVRVTLGKFGMKFQPEQRGHSRLVVLFEDASAYAYIVLDTARAHHHKLTRNGYRISIYHM